MPFKQDRTVNNISEIISGVSQDLRDLGEPVWYRGQSNRKWNLIPSLYRSGIAKGTKEMHLMKKFKQDATSLLQRPEMKPHQWLFVMRHYNVPTRLLDWTESPLAATFFATKKRVRRTDGAIWILRPIQLNKQEGREFTDVEISLPSFEEDEGIMKGYNPTSVFESETGEMNPIAFIYPRNMARMRAQRSVYTIHHLKKVSIEKIGDESHIWKYIIPKEAKKNIREELALLGITQFQLFPELESVGQNLVKEVKKQR